jgi:hybrid cluster-associated redox disulfide protein
MAGLLTRRPGAAGVLVSRGMHCIGCAIARFETIAEACAIYGVSVEQLLLDIDRQAAENRRRPVVRPEEPLRRRLTRQGS